MGTNCKRLSNTAVVLSAISVLMFSASPSRAQCTAGSCGSLVGGGSGDYNFSGAVTVADVVALENYILTNPGASPPITLCNVEINGYCNPYFPCEPTFGDLLQLRDHVFSSGTVVLCTDAVEPTTAALQVLVTSPNEPYVILPSGSGIQAVQLRLENNSGGEINLRGYSAPLRIMGARGNSPYVDQVEIASVFDNAGSWMTSEHVRSVARVFVVAWDDAGGTVAVSGDQGVEDFITLNVHYSGVPAGGTRITVNSYTAPPGDVPAFYTPEVTKSAVNGGFQESELNIGTLVTSPEQVPSGAPFGWIVLVLGITGIGLLYIRFRARIEERL